MINIDRVLYIENRMKNFERRVFAFFARIPKLFSTIVNNMNPRLYIPGMRPKFKIGKTVKIITMSKEDYLRLSMKTPYMWSHWMGYMGRSFVVIGRYYDSTSWYYNLQCSDIIESNFTWKESLLEPSESSIEDIEEEESFLRMGIKLH